MKTATIVINRYALRHNIKQIRSLAPASKIIAIVKANAYGHALLETAKVLKDADAFGVGRIEEAILLRKGGIKQPILLLGGFYSYNELSILVNHKIQTTVHNVKQLEFIELAKLKKPITVWIKLDTGMHRLGLQLEQAESFYQRLKNCKNVKKPINIISHFACANEIGCKTTERQLNLFKKFCYNKPCLRSIAASSGILLWPESHFDWVRPGIILYGISPLNGKLCGADFGFQPVMSLTSSLIAIRKYKYGNPVGYGGTWISNRNTFLGIVAIGYGDGYPHGIPSGTPVLVNGREVKTVGYVMMDMTFIDLGPRLQDKIGDPVILWGNHLPIERIARISGISVYELVTRLTTRLIVEYIN